MSIARDGLREISALTIIWLGLTALSSWAALNQSPWFWALAAVFVGLWVFTIAFFRDPHREIPGGEGIFVSPADGKVTEITNLDHHELVKGPAIRISIFLSVFDVHINRSPCAGRVVDSQYKAGEFLDARHPECGVRNEANTIVIEPAEGIAGPVIVRQIAGLIARRIICRLAPGDRLERGQRIGMIKFGSRTELVVPASAGFTPAVRVGQYVKGGATVLMQRSQTTTQQSGTTASRAQEHVVA